MEDLSEYILFNREKLVSVRAAIRAMDKLNVAQEVRNQKKEEAQMLSEALLDAEVRLGDLLKLVPKAPGLRTDIIKKQPMDGGVPRLEESKHRIIKELGFTEKQKQRFETLANNKDLVEQVKAEARENDDIPTRSRVLDLAQQRKKREEESISQPHQDEDFNAYIDFCGKVANGFNTAIGRVAMLKVDEEHLKAWGEMLPKPDSQGPFGKMIEEYIGYVDVAIPKLLKIKNFLKEEMKK